MGGDNHFCEVFFSDVPVPADCLLGQEGAGWVQVNTELAFERGGPERYLSTWPLFAEVAAAAGASSDRVLIETIGTFTARMIGIRQLSAEIAEAMDRGADFRAQAAVEKDAGTAFEQEFVEAVRTVGLDVAAENGRLARLLADASAAAPSFTLRGGTSEILRTIIARQIEGH